MTAIIIVASSYEDALGLERKKVVEVERRCLKTREKPIW